MTQPDMTEQEAYYERTRRPIMTVPTSRPGRFLFGLMIGVWFLILLLPCAFFVLATSGSIRLNHGAVPEPETHPLFEMALIMSPEQRGLQLTRSVLSSGDATNQCVETYVSYVLWQTDGTDASVVYCDCYTRSDPQAVWTLASAVYTACGTDR